MNRLEVSVSVCKTERLDIALLVTCKKPHESKEVTLLMDGPLLKELTKLETLTAQSSGKGKGVSVVESLDSLLQTLYQAKAQGTLSVDAVGQLVNTVNARKKDIDDRQKEVYSSIARIGKALDKVNYQTDHTAFHLCRNSPSLCLRIPVCLQARNLSKL